MSQKKVQRVVAAGAFTILLGLAGSAPVEARELRGPARLLGWLSGLWENGVMALRPEGPAGATEKIGPATDPNGKPLPNAGPSGAPCGAACEQGPASEPNG
jgi:hypothetical protein